MHYYYVARALSGGWTRLKAASHADAAIKFLARTNWTCFEAVTVLVRLGPSGETCTIRVSVGEFNG